MRQCPASFPNLIQYNVLYDFSKNHESFGLYSKKQFIDVISRKSPGASRIWDKIVNLYSVGGLVHDRSGIYMKVFGNVFCALFTMENLVTPYTSCLIKTIIVFYYIRYTCLKKNRIACLGTDHVP
ncbi:hypothetical protein HCUR_00773 [Holospora curviuscula]|uniref:Uncharacterized protein n=1 Tax=Holospora curviuscula TaxID=1082868 RepID=A0A2S5R8W0_9PROT|nr:hypothetical protein HCUR_00773 [Holospora curviuscula]